MARSSPISLFKSKLLESKVKKAILPQFRFGKDPEYDYYVHTKLSLIEDLFRLMKLSIQFHEPYAYIITNIETFYELYDKPITDLEILLNGMEKEFKNHRCYDGC